MTIYADLWSLQSLGQPAAGGVVSVLVRLYGYEIWDSLCITGCGLCSRSLLSWIVCLDWDGVMEVTLMEPLQYLLIQDSATLSRTAILGASFATLTGFGGEDKGSFPLIAFAEPGL